MTHPATIAYRWGGWRDGCNALLQRLSLQGLMRPDMRLPLVELDNPAKVAVKDAMEYLGHPAEERTPQLCAQASPES